MLSSSLPPDHTSGALAVEPVAHVQFAGGSMRPVFETDGRQFVLGDDEEPVYGVWYIPPDDGPVPLIVPAGPLAEHF
jgi:hypothetical protein